MNKLQLQKAELDYQTRLVRAEEELQAAFKAFQAELRAARRDYLVAIGIAPEPKP